jgi:hypothetical protein
MGLVVFNKKLGFKISSQNFIFSLFAFKSTPHYRTFPVRKMHVELSYSNRKRIFRSSHARVV